MLEAEPVTSMHLIPSPAHRPASQLLPGRSSLLSYSLFSALLPSIPCLEASRVYIDAVATRIKSLTIGIRTLHPPAVLKQGGPCVVPPSSMLCSHLHHSKDSTTSSVSFKAWGTSWGGRTWDRKSPTCLHPVL